MARIALGPGHSPPDFGACYRGLREHIEAVKVFVGLDRLLRDGNMGHAVLELFGPLSAKVEEVNAWRPDIALELHFNAVAPSDGGEARGAETLYFPGSEKGKALAERIQRALVSVCNLRDRGVKPREDLYFLAKTACPAVIVEPLFISSRKDTRILLARRDDIVMAIFIGIQDYFRET